MYFAILQMADNQSLQKNEKNAAANVVVHRGVLP